jgi:hypothetical protein
MPYTVNFNPPARPLERADVVFDVNWNKSKLGTLHVSKGSLVWVPVHQQYGYKLDWKKFGNLMEAAGVPGHEG